MVCHLGPSTVRRVALLLLSFAAASLAPASSRAGIRQHLGPHAGVGIGLQRGRAELFGIRSNGGAGTSRALRGVTPVGFLRAMPWVRAQSPSKPSPQGDKGEPAEVAGRVPRESPRSSIKRQRDGGRRGASRRRPGQPAPTMTSPRPAAVAAPTERVSANPEVSGIGPPEGELAPVRPPKAVIQFRKGGKNETAIPEVKLAEAKDGSSRTATFVFEYPDIIREFLRAPMDQVLTGGFIQGMFMVDEEGEIRTYELDSVFTKGKPSGVVAKYITSNLEEWSRFMRFMERFAETSDLEFKAIPRNAPPSSRD